jgi:uncharacterized membrane protein YgdD (TMEM256/DUF423 family)
MNARVCIFTGGLFGAFGVAAGAFGAHVLEDVISPEKMDTFEVAVRYQLLHASALVLTGVLADRWPSRTIRAAGAAFLLGMVLFSGCLYAWLLTGVKIFVLAVPIGGGALIAGWAALAGAGWASSKP